MSSLNAFLNPIKEENAKVVASKRFVGENGKPVEWEIRALTGEEDEVIRKKCTRSVPVPGKRGQYTNETDINRYLGELAATCTVYPNLNDATLQKAYGVLGADSLLKTMLKAGEYAEYLEKVQKISGYDQTMEDLVDEAKN
ncbi:phage tail assembly chaperone [Sinanaerobacter sp. ZZT-01]|uniref:phage tail assembly chaperone n=1 Tax=Sinanaerobacter sp. ZZT-01 TaxID=3111540 RepID=UPI002D782805|nr:phage portal protein [Sinanaerobacter sp. ZZT-01]WRR94090.1 phage portal protein [Sinanaerobacter sp. ZZT-01]